MKAIKLYLTVICSLGGGVVFVDQKVLDGAIEDALNLNPVLQQIILTLIVISFIIRLIWFVYDKFYLETKERKQAMREIDAKHD